MLTVNRPKKYGNAPFWETLSDYFEHCQTGCAIERVIDNGTEIKELFMNLKMAPLILKVFVSQIWVLLHGLG